MKEIKVKKPFYIQTWFIVILAALSIFIIPLPIAIFLVYKQYKFDKEIKQVIIDDIHKEIDGDIDSASEDAQKIIDIANKKAEEIISANESVQKRKIEAEGILESLEDSIQKLEKREASLDRKTKKVKIAQKTILDSIKYYRKNSIYKEIPEDAIDLIGPTVEIQTHSMDVKVLKKRRSHIKSEIKKVLKEYDDRYNTKANKSIYSLMVIGLQAELQNVLSKLKYDRKEKAISNIKEISSKYMTIASNGNQSLYSTIVRFVGEVESLFLNLVDTEYEYYVKREAEKEEQRAIKAQMREDASERARLKEERKKVEKEEKKYKTEMESIEKQIKTNGDDDLIKQLEARLKELENQLEEVEVQKEEITSLQNGKAGYVYVISNIGSFGEEIFKVGMTRRLNPMDRVRELGDASVPFRFDVHSFIFSDDASSLETQLHVQLEDNRVNKVNSRKEFFKIPLDEIEEIVSDVDPTAEFTRTILAEEYKQSLEIIESEVTESAS